MNAMILLFLGAFSFLANSSWAQVKVSSISFELNESVDIPKVINLLGLQEGDDFSEAKLDQGLSRLALTLDYRSIEASFDESTGRLTVALFVHNRLKGVRVNFPLFPSGPPDYIREDIEQAVGIKEGDIVSQEAIESMRSRIREAVSRRGFSDFDVVVVIARDSDGAERFLEVTISSGKRNYVHALGFAGLDDLAHRRLFSKLREQESIVGALTGIGIDGFKRGELREEMIFDREAFSLAREEFVKSYRDDGFYDISLQVLAEGTEKRTINFLLNKGFKYDLQIEGSTVFWERDLRAKLLERSVNLGLPFNVLEGELRLLRMYKDLGYKDVEVEKEIETDGLDKTITFKLNEGKQFAFSGLVFRGSRGESKEILEAAEKRWLLPLKSPYHHIYYIPEQIVGRLPQFLQELRNDGFLDAKILSYRFQQQGEGRFYKLELNVQLGQRYRVRNVNVLGNIVLSGTEVDEIVRLRSGEFVNPGLALEIGNDLLAQYQRRGFINAEVTSTEEGIFTFPREKGVVDVSYSIVPGPQVYLGQIIVEGNEATKDQVISREQREGELFEGEEMSPQGLREYEQRLLGLGLFSTVKLKPVNGRIVQRNDENAGTVEVQEKDLRVAVRERPAGSVEFGPGFRTDLGIIGFAELNYRNLGGWNRSIFLRSQVSRKLSDYQFLEQKYSLVYLEPYLFDWRVLMRFRLNYRKRDDLKYKQGEPFSGFNSEETTFALSTERELFKDFIWIYDLYEYSISRVFDKVSEVDDQSSYYQIASLGSRFRYDKRDNIFNPRRGYFLETVINWAVPQLGGDDDANFLLWRQSGTIYFPLKTPGPVVAMSASYARIWGLERSQQIPENRRLVLGGRSSIRSLPERFLRFDENGVLDQQSYNLRFEYRQPIFEDWGIAPFFEGGQVDVIRKKGRPLRRRSTRFRKGAGLGLRYATPVGPVSIDLGYNIDAEEGEDRYRFSLSIGSF